MLPSTLMLLLLMMCYGPLSSTRVDYSSLCRVECFPLARCQQTQTGEDIAIKCVDSVSTMRLDGDKFWPNTQWRCNGRTTGNYWMNGASSRTIKTVECPEKLSCLDHSPLVSSCRGSKMCKELPLLSTADPLKDSVGCEFEDASILMTDPETMNVRKLFIRLDCDRNTGLWSSKDYDSNAEVKVPTGANVRCVRSTDATEVVNKSALMEATMRGDQKRSWNLHGTLLFLVSSFFSGGYAYYIYRRRYQRRHRSHLREQELMEPFPTVAEEHIARLRNEKAWAHSRSNPLPRPPLPEPLSAEILAKLKKYEIDPAQIDKDCIASDPSDHPPPPPPSASQGEKEKDGKKKEKEYIGDEQYDTVVAMDKYFTKMDRAMQKIEDFSNDDLEESWRASLAPEGGLSKVSKASKMSKLSRHSRTSVKGAVSRAAKARMVSRRMAESMKYNEGMGVTATSTVNKSSKRQPSGLLDSKAETSRGIF